MVPGYMLIIVNVSLKILEFYIQKFYLLINTPNWKEVDEEDFLEKLWKSSSTLLFVNMQITILRYMIDVMLDCHSKK